MTWDEAIFSCLCRVNQNLHKGLSLTEKATQLLSQMESCLCSGDGLSCRTAFKAGSTVVIDKTLGMLGMMEAVSGMDTKKGISIVSFNENPYGVNKLYFIL